MFFRDVAKASLAWRRPKPITIRVPRHRTLTSSIPTIKSCPSPTCACAATPAMPAKMPINYDKPLGGSMGAYTEQVLVCTGKDDWTSKIEDENAGDNLAADLWELLGKGGDYSDPFHRISVLNTSFPSSIPERPDIQTTSAYLLPSFKYIPFLPRVSFDSVHALVKGYLLPTHLDLRHDGLSPIHRDRLTRKADEARLLPGVQDVTDVLVLICGHGERDARCGILGPVLRGEFEERLEGKRFVVGKGPMDGGEGEECEDTEGRRTARVGLISHIGGHIFAGNVIVYLPPGLKMADGKANPLAGCGVWYGRVEPKHVEGIVKETIMEGKVIEDHFRGGIKQGGELLWL